MSHRTREEEETVVSPMIRQSVVFLAELANRRAVLPTLERAKEWASPFGSSDLTWHPVGPNAWRCREIRAVITSVQSIA